VTTGGFSLKCAAETGLLRDNRKDTSMKKLTRYIALTVASALLAVTANVYAGPCCDEAVERAKKGKMCIYCAEKDCCREAIKRLSDDPKPCNKSRCKKKAATAKGDDKKDDGKKEGK